MGDHVNRGATAHAFQPAVVRQWTDRFREIAREHVERFLSFDGEADVVVDLTRHYPLDTVMEMLGYTLDNLSMMALILSIGFVVDDAIVML